MRRLLMCGLGALLVVGLVQVSTNRALAWNDLTQTASKEKDKDKDKDKQEKKGATKTTSGTVSSVSGSSLSVKSGKEDMTFTVDEKTDVIGTGVGTKARE